MKRKIVPTLAVITAICAASFVKIEKIVSDKNAVQQPVLYWFKFCNGGINPIPAGLGPYTTNPWFCASGESFICAEAFYQYSTQAGTGALVPVGPPAIIVRQNFNICPPLLPPH